MTVTFRQTQPGVLSGGREGAEPEAMQTGLGAHAGCYQTAVPWMRATQDKTNDHRKQTKRNKTQPLLRWSSLQVFHSLILGVTLQPDGTFINSLEKGPGPQRVRAVATYPYWSGWCIMGA